MKLTARDVPFASHGSSERAGAFLSLADGRYLLKAVDLGMVLEVDRLRWDKHELRCELTVRCDLAGAPVHNGILTSGSFNLSYVGARRTQAGHIAGRARVDQAKVVAALDELCQRVLVAERVGKPAALLHTFNRPTVDDAIGIDGIVLPQRHPAILFGDGGCGKSYIALLILGMLARRGLSVMFVDWELDGRDHRDRLERLFGADMPHVHYARCDRPMVAEADRLRRLVFEHKIDYAAFDSVAFACDGPPESAEAAAGYFRAVRQLGAIGSLHLAHVTKPGVDQKAGEYKPFGSVFWHNSARSTWFVKRADPTSEDDNRVVVGLYNRKSNLGGLRPPVGLQLTFDEASTDVTRADLAEVAELAGNLPMWRRIKPVLASGPRTIAEIAEELDATADTVKKALTRDRGRVFVCLSKTADGVHRWALHERRAS